MNQTNDLDDLVTTAIEDRMRVRAPTDLLERVLDTTRNHRQRSPWLAAATGHHLTSRPVTLRLRKERPVNGTIRFIAALAAVAIAAVVGFAVLAPRSDQSVGGPAASPQPSAVTSRGDTSAEPTPEASAIARDLPGRFAFAASRTGNSEIYSMKPDGSGLIQLTDDPAADGLPAWSPDGTSIVFTRTEAGGSSIWTMDADGSAARRLAEGETPKWSPDGDRIVYAADGTISVIGTDGSAPEAVVSEGTQGLRYVTSPAWLGDDTHIVFIGSRGDGLGSDVYSVGVDGDGLEKLTATTAEEAAPHTSPDGRRVAYFTHSTCICVMDADGSAAAELAKWTGKGASLTWSPDGEWIAIAGGAHGPAFVEVVRADGSARIRITEAGDFADITWGP